MRALTSVFVCVYVASDAVCRCGVLDACVRAYVRVCVRVRDCVCLRARVRV